MTPIRMLQTSPVRANELFAQLADTGPGAVKTRDRLFGELKTELETHARLEAEHLLPVMKKHAGTKGLVAGAVEGGKRTAALLAEIEAMPRDGDAFAGKVVELQKLFRQHLRDEKNEMLPALQKALDDEEAQAVADKVEADRAAVEQAAADAAELERAAARRERDTAARVRAAAEDAERVAREALAETRRAAKASAETARAAAETGRDVVQTGLRASAEIGERSVERFTQALDASRQSTRALTGVAQCGTVMAQGWQGASREWMSWAQGRFQSRMQAAGQLMQCRTPQDLIALQTRLVREDAERLLATTGRVAEIASSSAEEATRVIASNA